VPKLVGGSGNGTLMARDVKDNLDGGTGADKAQVDRSDVKVSIEKILK